ncbi:hypothetical protein BH10PSE10_BH10PSE10_13850 [soil metagenome]
MVLGMNAAWGLSGFRKIVCGNSARRSGIGIAAVIGLMVAAPGLALASPGCSALLGSATGGVTTGNTSGTGFSAGDVVTVSLTGFGAFASIGLENTTAATVLLTDSAAPGTRTYTVPANTTATFTVIGGLTDPSPSYTWSCVSASGSGGTDSDKLKSVQTTGSTIVANTSGSNISGSVGSAVDNALSGAPSGGAGGATGGPPGPPSPPPPAEKILTREEYAWLSVKREYGVQLTAFSQSRIEKELDYYRVRFDDEVRDGWVHVDAPDNPFLYVRRKATMSQFAPEARSDITRRADDAFAVLGYAAVNKAPPLAAPVFAPQWSTWADVRGSGFEQSDSRALKGTQINASGGITYRLRPDLVVGAFAGYENFNYDFASLTGNLKGNGGTIGGYAGWQITPTLRWKGMIGWTGLGYDASAATASGGFDGSRWLVSTGLSGSYRVAAFIVEPSADVFAIWEHQTGYIDNLGAAHDSRNFSTGRVSLGGRALAPALGPFGVTPYLGVYGDWRFASDNTLPAAVPFAGIGDGLSARVTGGFNTRVFAAGSLTLGGEYGGIGADYKLWTGNARLMVPF